MWLSIHTTHRKSGREWSLTGQICKQCVCCVWVCGGKVLVADTWLPCCNITSAQAGQLVGPGGEEQVFYVEKPHHTHLKGPITHSDKINMKH